MIKTSTELNRIDLTKLFKGVGVEIGVERAVFSEIITQNPEVTMLYGVDPLKAYKGYREHVTQLKLDGFLTEIMNRMFGKRYVFIRDFSISASNQFMDGALDFVYIDANHDYENALADIKAWASKVKSGGIVSGHDYIARKGQKDLFNVIEAVDEYARQEGIGELIIYRGDKSPSWMFIKK